MLNERQRLWAINWKNPIVKWKCYLSANDSHLM